MKQNESRLNPKPILIHTTYTPISQNKDDKTKYRQRKNGTNMPFFHPLGVFLPIYNRGRKKKILLESFEQKARLGAQEHPKRKSMAQGSRIDGTIFQLQTTSISDITIGFSPKNIVSTKRACIFHTPKSSVHMRKSRTFVLERNRVEERTTIRVEDEAPATSGGNHQPTLQHRC